MRRYLATAGACLLWTVSLAGAQVAGSATGLTPSGVSCRNLSTGQSVISTSTGLEWDCAALGLSFEAGDRLQLGIRGGVPSEGASGPMEVVLLPEDFVSHIVPESDLDGGAAIPADLDGDGDLDVAASNDFLWFENLGGPDPTFVKHLLDGPIATAFSHFVIDVNRDQRLDLVASFEIGSELLWFENREGSPPTFTGRPIDRRPGWVVRDLDGGDLDGDGDTDFFALWFTKGCPPCDEEVVWYEDTGGGYSRHSIELDFGSGSGILAVDVDGDEDLDLVFSDLLEERLSWFENQAGSFTEKHPIQQGSFNLVGLVASDLDSDGDPDLVGYERNGEELLWFENSGEGRFVPRPIAVIPDRTNDAIAVADFSADGRPDIVIGDNVEVLIWLENLGGSPPEFEQHSVEVQAATQFPVAGDLDGDGRLDLVDTFIGELIWHENQIGLRLSVTGLGVRTFSCRNRTTGQSVRVETTETEIDCEQEGLVVGSGDEIEAVVRGQVQ